MSKSAVSVPPSPRSLDADSAPLLVAGEGVLGATAAEGTQVRAAARRVDARGVQRAGVRHRGRGRRGRRHCACAHVRQRAHRLHRHS